MTMSAEDFAELAAFAARTAIDLDQPGWNDQVVARNAVEAIERLLALVVELHIQRDNAQLRSIEARNPGIDLNDVQRVRGGGWARVPDLRNRTYYRRIEGHAVLSDRWLSIIDPYWDDCVIQVQWRLRTDPLGAQDYRRARGAVQLPDGTKSEDVVREARG